MIQAQFKWQGKTIRVPDDIEIRITIHSHHTSIGTIPHSYLGERFAYNASKEEKISFLGIVLSGGSNEC